jgi:hypothetical protein
MRKDIFLIGRTSSVKEIQDHFSALFPFLRINFFKSRKTGMGFTGPSVILFSPESYLTDINPDIINGELAIRESMSVRELENEFLEKFGLSVQVLRKSGNLWLDTSRTNSWTLLEQDEIGREISPEQKRNLNISGKNGFHRSLG